MVLLYSFAPTTRLESSFSSLLLVLPLHCRSVYEPEVEVSLFLFSPWTSMSGQRSLEGSSSQFLTSTFSSNTPTSSNFDASSSTGLSETPVASSTSNLTSSPPIEVPSHLGSDAPPSVKPTTTGPLTSEIGTSESTTSRISTSTSISSTAESQPVTTKSQWMPTSSTSSTTTSIFTNSPGQDNTPAAPAPSSDTPPSSTGSMSTKPVATSTSHTESSTHTSATKPPPPPTTTPKPTGSQSHSESPSVKADASAPPAPVTTAVTVVKGSPSHTATVTITPTITLSSPVALNVTVDGSNFLSTPPVITILSTSTNPNGDLVTITEVATNPTEKPNSVKESSGSVLQHKGAVAGIFVVVGLAVVSIFIGLFLFLRRQRKLRKRNKWLEGMQPQPATSFSDNDPFMDPHTATPPNMRSVDDNHYYAGQWPQRISPISPLADVPMQHPHDNRDFGYGGAIPLGNGVHSTSSAEDYQPHSMPEPVGHAYTTDYTHNQDLLHPQQYQYENTNNRDKRHSYAPSSPSIYPASLPNEDEEAIRQEVKTQETTGLGAIPPRPPRSRLRQSARNSDLTPLSTVSSSHSGAYTGMRPPSPIGETTPQDIFARRTLLDVRARPIPPPK
ncbi:hypothetical protein CPB83DRAFT_12377 [Crepidotus variabilis]|uniref:Uncharacterized protein n=1 Tax=Crepidotus variabilis TaxID=179855 RepID=A0A9P6EU91_9AGAR|nr:hypothetical protein CPB83DRAFT_12377 [Crepidotus variabilis]